MPNVPAHLFPSPATLFLVRKRGSASGCSAPIERPRCCRHWGTRCPFCLSFCRRRWHEQKKKNNKNMKKEEKIVFRSDEKVARSSRILSASFFSCRKNLKKSRAYFNGKEWYGSFCLHYIAIVFHGDKKSTDLMLLFVVFLSERFFFTNLIWKRFCAYNWHFCYTWGCFLLFFPLRTIRIKFLFIYFHIASTSFVEFWLKRRCICLEKRVSNPLHVSLLNIFSGTALPVSFQTVFKLWEEGLGGFSLKE